MLSLSSSVLDTCLLHVLKKLYRFSSGARTSFFLVGWGVGGIYYFTILLGSVHLSFRMLSFYHYIILAFLIVLLYISCLLILRHFYCS